MKTEKVVVVMVAGLAAAIAGCEPDPVAEEPLGRPAGPEVSFDADLVAGPLLIVEGWSGQQSERVEPGFEVIRDEASLRQAWELISPGTEPPAVDFDEHMVIAAWMGQQRTGGHTIELREIRPAARQSRGYAAVIDRYEPGPDEFVTQAITSPYHLAVVPRTDAEVRPIPHRR